MEAQNLTERVLTLERVKMVFQTLGEGPPTVLLHGLPSPGIWNRVLPHLSPHLSCTCPHSLVLGASDSAETADYPLEAQAEWIRRFMDRAGLERVHLLGHDLGGVMALVLATRYPHRIARLIISHTPPRQDWHHPLLRRLRAWSTAPFGLALFGKLLGRQGFARSKWGWGDTLYHASALGPTDLATWASSLAGSRPRLLRTLLRALDPLLTSEVIEAVRNYQRPTMLLWGCDYPPLSPSWAIQLYHEIPGAERFELIPFAGHFPQWERPEAFARAVLDFLLVDEPHRTAPTADATPSPTSRSPS